MPALVEADPAKARSLASLMPNGTHVVPGMEQLDTWLTSRPEEYVVVLGPGVPMDSATQLASRMHRSNPTTEVVLLRDRLDTEVYARATQAGIRAVVADHDRETLTIAMERARQTFEATHGPLGEASAAPAKVLTVFSAKGGVGKTTVAVNLGLALAERGSRVCIVDLDLEYGDVAITLQLVPEHTIAEAAEVEEHVDVGLLETLLTDYQGKLKILAAPLQPDARDRIHPALITRIIQVLRARFDYILIDTAPTLDEHVLHAFDETDECVLVATLDIPTVKNVKMAIETMDLLNLCRGHRHLFLNRADEEVGLAVEKVESLLGLPVTVAVPSSLAVAISTNQGRPILQSKPDHAVSKAIRSFASALRGEDTPARKGKRAKVEAVPVDAKRGLFGRGRK